MQCFQCGTQFADGASNCPNCGMPVTANQFTGAQQTYQQGQPYMQGQPYQQTQAYNSNQPLSKKEFMKHPNLSSSRGNCTYSAVILYVCAGLSFILVGLVGGSFSVIIDVLIVVGLALGVQLAQSRICAILILIYSVFNMISLQSSTGHSGERLLMIAGVYALIATFQCQSAWKKYKRTGALPTPK